MSVYKIYKDTKGIIWALLFYPTTSFIRIVHSSSISCCKILQKFNPEDSGCFCFCISPQVNFFRKLWLLLKYYLYKEYRPFFFIISIIDWFRKFLRLYMGYVPRSRYRQVAKRRMKETVCCTFRIPKENIIY